jgi:hypothetical protein
MRTPFACLIGLLAVALAAPAAAQSKWIAKAGKSTRDQSPAISLMLLPDLGDVGLSGLCIEGDTRINLTPLKPPPLPSGTATLDFSYRIDKGTSQRRAFALVDGGRSFELHGAAAIEMFKEMLGRQQMTLRYEFPAGGRDAAEYSIAGLDNAIAGFRSTCRW